MKRTTLACLASSILPLAACVGGTLKPDLPAILVPAGEKAVDRVSARGVQVYQCRAGADGAKPAWAFVAPEASLLDAGGREAGRHYAGPHWEANDGSRIVGTVKARAEAPRPGDIPWLLLATRSVGSTGRFSAITSVQRVNTEGGAAPALACDAGSLGATVRVPYTADYVLLSSALATAM